MEKQLRQFAPFVALVVAALLVVIANPGDSGGGSDEPAKVAGIAATRTTTSTTGVPAEAASVPAGATAPADATPFAPAAASGSTATSSSFSSSTFSSGTATAESTTSFAAPATTTPSFDSPTTTAATIPIDTTTTTAAGDVPGVSDFFLFAAVDSSAACSAGGDVDKPLKLASAYNQAKIVSEPNFPDRAGGIALNKADPDPERFIYRTHSLISTSSVSVTDTAAANATRILSQRSDWERFDALAWTPNKTLLVGENIRVAEKPDPVATTAKAGLVYELDPYTGAATVRPALGSKAHRGMAFDHLGNLYSVSATNPGFVYRFVPAAPNNYSAGTLSALWIGSNGESMWLVLNNPSFDPKVDADAAAMAAGATQLLSPEDAETLTVTAPNGSKRSQLFIAEQGANRVLTVVLRGSDNTAYTATYVAPGVNAPKDFAAPSDLIIDTPYNLYIAERNGGGSESSKTEGDDIWVAPANSTSAVLALPAGRLASVTDCDAEPAGLMFDLPSSRLYMDLKHRGGDGRDMTLLITKSGGN